MSRLLTSHYTDPELAGDDHPSGKIWSVYVSEAEKEDRALAEGWKGDMEGLLIFAGLFSASVTAFIVEGYKSLQQDPGNTTNTLLAQISLQLANMANGSPTNVSSFATAVPQPYSPTMSTVRYNTFWFLSLAFSLACALSATLVQQWSRYYLQAIERRAAPHHRARVRSYLHEGITTFKMTAVVEFIPLLLHISLFLFFAGLVEFLIPINPVIGYITLAAALVCGTAYITITLLPLPFRQCPYRTPLSGLIWRMLQLLRLLQYRPLHGLYKGSLAQTREYHAMGGVPGERDRTALQWVLGSITENRTLEAFVDGIPEFFYSDRRELGYDPCDVFDEFLRKSPIQLGAKIGRLLQSCSFGALTKEAAQKRAFTCLNAISALTLRLSDKSISGWMQNAWLDGFVNSIPDELVRLKRDASPSVASYAHYVSALMAYKWQKEFLIIAMKEFDFGENEHELKNAALGGVDQTKSERLASLLGVLDKLDAVQSMEEVVNLKIMPSRGSGDTHALMTNIWELRKMLRTQLSPSLKCKQILDMVRASSLIHFLNVLQQWPPVTDECHSMAFSILSVISGHYGGTMKGLQDRHDLLASDSATQFLVARAVGDALGGSQGYPYKYPWLSLRICDVLVWFLASLTDPSATEEADRIIRDFHEMHPSSIAAQHALDLQNTRDAGMSPKDCLEWMDIYQTKIWPESDGRYR